MNLLQVGVKLKAQNIQSFVDDFMKIDGVSISDIQLHDGMVLINKIKYKSFGTLSVGFGIDRVEDGVVSISVKKIKAISIPINVMPVNLLLKIVLNKVNIAGIFWDESQIKIDLPTVFKEFGLDFLNLNVKDIHITEESIDLLVDNIDLNMKKLMDNSKTKNNKSNSSNEEDKIKNVESLPLLVEEIHEENFESNFRDHRENFEFSNEDFCFQKNFHQYSSFRENIYNSKFKETGKDLLGKILFLLPDIGVLSYRLLRDKRIKKTKKILIGFTIAYILNPFDKFNKKFPVLSKVDDGILLIFTLSKIFTGIDRSILENHFDGSGDTLNFLIDTFDVLNQFMGLDRINRLYTVFEKFIK